MKYDELKQQILTMLPDAVLDYDFNTGEVMIASGMVRQADDTVSRVEIGDNF